MARCSDVTDERTKAQKGDVICWGGTHVRTRAWATIQRSPSCHCISRLMTRRFGCTIHPRKCHKHPNSEQRALCGRQRNKANFQIQLMPHERPHVRKRELYKDVNMGINCYFHTESSCLCPYSIIASN